MVHALISLVVATIGGLAFGSWLLAATFMAGFYLGREHGGAEYRWIEQYGEGRRANMPWWGGFDPKVWSRDSVLDFTGPLIVLVAIGVWA